MNWQTSTTTGWYCHNCWWTTNDPNWIDKYYDEEHEVTAELWATEGMGKMALAMPGDLHQIDLVPSVISWAIEPVPYPARQ